MISRRRFLELGSAIAGVAATSRQMSAAQADNSSLPPAIAQLKSRKSEAMPISVEERTQRQEHARKLLAENFLDAIVLIEGTSLRYFTGIRWWGGERMFAWILPAKGAPFYVCPAFEEARAREQLRNAPGGTNAEVRLWQEDDSPYQLVAQCLKDRHMVAGTIGIEETVPFVFADGIAKAVPRAVLTSATPVTAGCRMIKSSHEIALMRVASQVTIAVYQAVYASLHAGMTQHDAGNLITAAYDRIGFPGDASIMVGEFSASPHGSRTPQVIREGMIIMIDDGCEVEGYQSDITRS